MAQPPGLLITSALTWIKLLANKFLAFDIPAFFLTEKCRNFYFC